MTGTSERTTTAAEFHIADPLPVGTLLLEASAGTGKTWAIAALVTRFVAEGHADLDQLLVVTFGRAASAELQDRVRERLVQAESVLAPGASAPPDDALLTLLVDTEDAERATRRRRLQHALSRFDEATITTTHGFCHTVLRSLGTTGDVEPGSALIEDDLDIVDQVVSDLYLRAVGRGAPPPFSPAEARALGRKVSEDPAGHLLPTDAEPDSVPDLRRRFATAVRDEASRRRLGARTLSYDDLLHRLAHALEPEDSAARAVMRGRWRIVLVDEFQDTDPVQWQILERAFAGHATLVLVGDPKQAIYSFRGGDVVTYLQAATIADERRTLATNHRSDAPLVASMDAVLRGTELGHQAIKVLPAHAAYEGSRLTDPRTARPFRLRVLTREDAGAPPDKFVPVQTARQRIAADVAADIAQLLRDSTLEHAGGTRSMRPGDVAVLVERHAEADLVHRSLTALGIAAVRGGGTDVLQSKAAADWLTLLTAMEAPHRSGLVRAAALGPFIGSDADSLAADDGDQVTDSVGARLRELADVQRTRGMAALVEILVDEATVVERVLGQEGGRRLLTDLQHVGHVLQKAARDDGLELTGLVRWLTDRRADGASAGDRTRRLDTDADAVQIVTTFVSKGLQYPVVYVPFLFDRYLRKPEVLRLHDEDGRRCLDVGGAGGPSWQKHLAQDRTERAGEALRLLYVAMTRAQSRLVMHWAPTWNGKHAALTRMLFRPDPTLPQIPEEQQPPPDTEAVTRLRWWEDRGGPVVERMITPAVDDGDEHGQAPAELAAREFTRDVDTLWSRISYSSLVRQDERQPATSEPVESGPGDEVEVEIGAESESELGPSPWVEVPSGAELGTLVHGVFEDIRPEAPDLAAEVGLRLGQRLAQRPLDVDPEILVPALLGALTTPLGPLAGDLTLVEALSLRPLREMEFELPLAGGDRSAAAHPRVLADVAELMETHLAEGDPLRPFASELRDASLAGRTLRGYLTGSVDLLLRLPDDRTLVVDHKTNRLEGVDGGLEAYAPRRLAEAMVRTTYPLQALLYTVGQHRFLRWRLPGYHPDDHLAGVLYLFVRGMTGPEVPRASDGSPFGVFAWRPPTPLVLGLSDLLDGSASRSMP